MDTCPPAAAPDPTSEPGQATSLPEDSLRAILTRFDQPARWGSSSEALKTRGDLWFPGGKATRVGFCSIANPSTSLPAHSKKTDFLTLDKEYKNRAARPSPAEPLSLIITTSKATCNDL